MYKITYPMQRQVFSSAVASLVFSAMVSPVFAQYVDQSAYTDAVASLSSAGVIDGGGNVRLNDQVNRAEALKIILLAQNQNALDVERMRSSMPPISLFPDVQQSQWYAPYVEVGFQKGLIKGYPDGRLRPEGGVKVVEAVAMITRSYKENTNIGFLSNDDLPNEQNQWYTGMISAVHSRNAVMQGSRLNAGNYMTRGQLFDMVYRMREVHLKGLTAFGQGASVVTIGNSAATTQTTTATNSTQFASKKPFAMSVPSIGIIDLTITHPKDPYTQKGVIEPLQDGVGHLFAYPGAGSKVLVYGHSSGYPWDLSKYTKIFRTINEVKVGARIYVTYSGKLYVYEVTEKKTVSANDKTQFEPDDSGEKLVLYTCWPPDSITNRYLVIATPVDTIALK